MKVFRPGLKPMYVDEPEPAPVPRSAEPTQAELIVMAKAQADARQSVVLRQDGPTLAEYIAAGYDPATYPPAGFAAQPEAAPQPKPLFGVHPTELIPPVAPKPLVDNNITTPGPSVDPLLK